ncbi:MAG: L-threonylcarbamoyladenylate synthase, partial [Candidatus Norongarragalinales archaeon]
RLRQLFLIVESIGVSMQIVDARKDAAYAEKKIIECVKQGGVFVYPTDTVYGIGCDARLAAAVEKIRRLKKRCSRKPFSVIAPSKRWIRENCFLNADAAKALERLLPGPFTLVLKLKNAACIAPATNAGARTLGIRIPKHWIAGIAKKTRTPVVTTSVNKAGAPPARTLAEIKKVIGKNKGVDLIVFEGVLAGKPSRVIDYSKNRAEIIR